MNKADRDRMLELCSLITVETDQARFQKFVEELNSILGSKEDEIKDEESGPQGA